MAEIMGFYSAWIKVFSKANTTKHLLKNLS